MPETFAVRRELRGALAWAFSKKVYSGELDSTMTEWSKQLETAESCKFKASMRGCRPVDM